MIHLKDINKSYYNGSPLHVLKGINLDIRKGEFVSIMGASGSGKSTLLNITGILNHYDSGEYYLNNILRKDLPETRSAENHNYMIGFISIIQSDFRQKYHGKCSLTPILSRNPTDTLTQKLSLFK